MVASVGVMTARLQRREPDCGTADGRGLLCNSSSGFSAVLLSSPGFYYSCTLSLVGDSLTSRRTEDESREVLGTPFGALGA